MRLLFMILTLGFLIFKLFAQDSTYTNPVGDFIKDGDTADPYVLRHEGKYYLYATSIQTHTYGYKVWMSENLVDWTDMGDCFRNTDSGNEWGKENFWAPEVVFYNGQYYMVYSARDAGGKLRIALAKSSSPLGPFINEAAPLLGEDLECIDGHLFIDDDGSPYLYYAKEINSNIVNGHHVSQIYVQPLARYYLRPAGDPVLCLTPDQAWEFKSGDWRWNEGPTVFKHNGVYYMTYSANFFASVDYAIGYATASSPLGLWTKYEGNPIVSSNLEIGVSGPGHNCVTYSPDGTEMFMVYHTHINPNDPNAGRTINIDRLVIGQDGILTLLGPTRTPQPMPSANATFLEKKSENLPEKIELKSIYPNPFNSAVKIKFSVANGARNPFVALTIFDLNGNKVHQLVQERLKAGTYHVTWQGKDGQNRTVPSGLYLCRLTVNQQVSVTRKLVFIK